MWLETPDTISTTTRCFQIAIPDNSDVVALILGALGALADADTWVQISETAMTPDAVAQRFQRMIVEMLDSNCP